MQAVGLNGLIVPYIFVLIFAYPEYIFSEWIKDICSEHKQSKVMHIIYSYELK